MKASFLMLRPWKGMGVFGSEESSYNGTKYGHDRRHFQSHAPQEMCLHVNMLFSAGDSLKSVSFLVMGKIMVR